MAEITRKDGYVCISYDNDDIRINHSKETSMKGNVPEFAVVSIKAYVAGGTDKYGSEKFIFDPDATNGAFYKISGQTLTSTLSYKGLY